MAIEQRAFAASEDFVGISQFLARHYQPMNADGNWLQPVWEYAYTHPYFDDEATRRIGIWHDAGRTVAVVTYELGLGEAFLNVDPSFAELKPAMLDHAERTLADDEGGLRVFAHEGDAAFERLLVSRGYERDPGADRPMSVISDLHAVAPATVPKGYRLLSLADENDLSQMNRVLHRGFEHEGEPTAEGTAGCARMQSGPNYRRDLAIAVADVTGSFVAFAGLWYDRANRYGYVEPVATDPAHRRRGLARAAVLEGVRRCAALGATVVYVNTDKPLYLACGFIPISRTHCYRRPSSRGAAS